MDRRTKSVSDKLRWYQHFVFDDNPSRAAAELHISEAAYLRYLSGEEIPSGEDLIRICNSLEFSRTDFLSKEIQSLLCLRIPQSERDTVLLLLDQF